MVPWGTLDFTRADSEELPSTTTFRVVGPIGCKILNPV